MLGALGEALYVGKARDLKKRSARISQAGLEPAHPDDAVAGASIEVTASRSEGEALLLENNLIKSPRAALQHPVPRRQVLSIPERHRHEFPRLGFQPRRERPAQPLLRPVSARLCGAREHSSSCKRVFRLRTCEDTVFENRSRPLPAAPDPPLQPRLAPPDFGRAVRRGCGERGAVPRRARGRCDPAA